MASSSAQTFFYIVTEYRNVAKHFAWNVGDEKKTKELNAKDM